MKRSFLVAGLGWGDEAKGATTDYLCWKYNASLIVRYNGGSQAGHSVVLPDGRWHTFQQFGAGMFHPGVRTHLSRFMLVNPMNMIREEDHLREVGIKDAWERTSVDPRALIITPYHRETNRLIVRDTTSCGQGVGVCRELHLAYGDECALFAGDLVNEEQTRTKLSFIRKTCLKALDSHGIKPFSEMLLSDISQEVILPWYRDWREKVRITKLTGMLVHEVIVFEGAQGVLLDETHGEPGFNTWTDCTFRNALELLEERCYDGHIIKVGVIRTYHTRHGAGPFPTEDPTLYHPEPHNEDTGPQGKFRRGRLDMNLFRKALDIIGGIDWLAINHLDQELIGHNLHAMLGQKREQRIIFGRGPTYRDREMLDE